MAISLGAGWSVVKHRGGNAYATRDPPKIREIVLMGGAYGTGNFTHLLSSTSLLTRRPHAWCSPPRSISDDGPRSYQPDRLHPGWIARMERAGGPAGELFSDIMTSLSKRSSKTTAWLAARCTTHLHRLFD